MVETIANIQVEKVASGAGHCIAINEFGWVYSWGASADFQTGIDVSPSGLPGEDTKQLVKYP